MNILISKYLDDKQLDITFEVTRGGEKEGELTRKALLREEVDTLVSILLGGQLGAMLIALGVLRDKYKEEEGDSEKIDAITDAMQVIMNIGSTFKEIVV
jgi:hypothetical protein